MRPGNRLTVMASVFSAQITSMWRPGGMGAAKCPLAGMSPRNRPLSSRMLAETAKARLDGRTNTTIACPGGATIGCGGATSAMKRAEVEAQAPSVRAPRATTARFHIRRCLMFLLLAILSDGLQSPGAGLFRDVAPGA